MLKKRAGAPPATNIATLIFLIALFIIFYVLLVPEETRKSLLGEDFTKSTVPVPGHGITSAGKVLLTTSPGKVYAVEKGTQVVPLTAARLYAKDQDETIDLADRVSISKGVFSDKPKELYFRLDDYSSVTSLNLFFFVNEPIDIYVEINGNRIYEGKISTSEIPINIPVKLLRKDNTLKIGLAGTYVMTKTVDLTSLSLKKVATVENRVAKRTFVLSDSEKKGLKSAYLDYFINCMFIDPKNNGEVSISLNGRVIFSDYIVCDAGLNEIKLDVKDIRAGTNTLTFEISKGDYYFESMELLLDISEKYFPQYTFEISSDDYDDIRGKCKVTDYDECAYDCNIDCRNYCRGYSNYNSCYKDCFTDCDEECFDYYCGGGKKLVMELQFPNKRDRKIASITINRDLVSLDTTSDVFFVDISPSANRGVNYIKIVPKNDFEITNLIVSLEPKT
ncbi:MAG: hypothetical protein QW404_02015 [Candidatus Nanoarchaeia archaeon]